MKKTLAASFIVTASYGCVVHTNPPEEPQAPQTPAAETPAAETPATETPTAETPQPTTEPAPETKTYPGTPKPKPTGDGDDLPEAKPGDKIVKQADGTCMAFPDVDCPPPPVTCNPPPPMKVKCPAE